MTMFDLQGYLSHKRFLIENALVEWLRKASPEKSRVREAMQYSLMAGGKRIRPLLCIAAAESVGGNEIDMLQAACAIEMVHTYSLIHDDLPAMDDDAMRRGKPTCHKAFDEATAILAGDALLTLAFEVLSTNSAPNPDRHTRSLEAIRILSRAAGSVGMIQGQMEDLASEGASVDMHKLSRLHGLKTGALIEASAEIGVVLCGGSPQEAHAVKTYARHLGLAFQVIDDILNVEGDPRIMGKAVGTDRLRKKSTYPALMGLAESKSFASECIDSALRALSNFDNKAAPLRAIAEYILKRRR